MDHTCTITRPGTDTRETDPESGQPIGDAPSATTVYSGRCRYTNDMARVMRAKGGDASLDGEALVILPERACVVDTETDTITVTGNGVTFSGRIVTPSYQAALVELLVAYEEAPVAA